MLDHTSTTLERTRAYCSKDPTHLRSILRHCARAHSLRTLKHTSPTLERTCAVGSIIITSSAPALNQLQHKLKCLHATGNTTDELAHLRSVLAMCTRAHLCRLHQNGPVPEILPNLCLVFFVSFFVFNFWCFCFFFLKKKKNI